MLSFSNQIGVDLGTRGVRVWVRSQGIVLDEPAVFALHRKDKSLEAVGRAAEAMRGRASDDAFFVSPLRDGAVADIDAVEAFLAWLVARYTGTPGRFRTTIMISVRPGATPVEKRALHLAALRAGARKVYLIESPFAAGLGMSLPVTEPIGRLVVDMGASRTSGGVLTVGDTAVSRSIAEAGDYFTDMLLRHIRTQHNIIVARPAAEWVKESLGSATPDLVSGTAEVFGHDLVSGRPTRHVVSAEEVCRTFDEGLKAIANMLRDIIEITPPELCADIAESGIYLAGAGALLHNLAIHINRTLGIEAVVAGDPRLTVIRGIGKALDHLQHLQRSLMAL